MHTATIAARDWWARPREDHAAAWVANYRNSLQVRHRAIIAEAVAGLQAESLLEIGCHCGPNLVRLAKELPGLSCLGLDVNAEAVKAGTDWASAEGLGGRVQLRHGGFPQATAAMDDGCVGVVLSCYTLGYMAPEDLDAVLYECGRLAKRAVILAEPMVLDGTGPQGHGNVSGYREWVHDYLRALRWIGTLRDMTTRIERVSPPVDRMNAVLVCTRG